MCAIVSGQIRSMVCVICTLLYYAHIHPVIRRLLLISTIQVIAMVYITHTRTRTHMHAHINKGQNLTQSSISLVCAAEMHILLLPSLIGVAGYPTTTTPRFRLKHSLLNALVIIIIKH